MRAVLWLSVLLTAALGAYAQSNAGFVQGGRQSIPQQGGINIGLPPLSPIPWLSPVQPFGQAPFGQAAPNAPFGRNPANFRSFPWTGFVGYPVLGSAYPAPQQPPIQNIVLIQTAPQAAPAAPQPPPSARPVIQEFRQATSAQPASTAEPRAFFVSLKDGTRLSALAVWADGNDLRYVDQEGAHWRVALSAIDREATRQLNRAQNLDLRLPPPAP